MTTAAEPAEGDAPFSLVLRLLALPDGFFETEVLRRLGPRDLASLAGVRRGCAAAVAATALMQWARDENNLGLRRCTFRREWTSWNPAPRLCWAEACSLAAYGGHLEVLKWLHGAGCPWGIPTCYTAAMGGHLDMLKWLHSAGCPWGIQTCYAAAHWRAPGDVDVALPLESKRWMLQ
jgi:phosphoglycolate phosphatase-like HAD superfamily hydrolase